MPKFDFSGYATKNGLKCTDGRTILKDAFKHNDGQTVPLVWQHLHNEPTNVLGHAILENRDDGVYCFGKFNDTEAGKNAKELVAHGDITALSIYANELEQKGKAVLHGAIREVSLVLSGANPGALIDNLSFAHGDGTLTEDATEAIIYTGLDLSKEKEEEPVVKHADPPPAEADKTVKDVFDTLNEEQKTVVYALIAEALGEAGDAAPEDVTPPEEVKHSDEGEEIMKKNVFDKEDGADKPANTLTHAQLQTIMADAQKGGSLKDSFLAHIGEYGIDHIDYLFPDAKTITSSPEFIQRQMEWVTKVINGAKHSPFSRIKSMSADITVETARALGYVKGALKKEEYFALAQRTTLPTTIYKKQKLDRDDIIDIVDLDVVAWMKAEMRVMLNEEIARAALIGDGREPGTADKITETCIRPIAKDDNFYAHKVQVAANSSGSTLIEEMLRNRTNYKGSGTPDLYTTEAILTDMLLVKDKIGRRIYMTVGELAATLRVGSIVVVDLIATVTSDTGNLVGVMVNMSDYTFGADKGGGISMFDDFDIDYNQYKYLMETRCSGCLTKAKSALVFWRATGTLATPTAATFVQGTNTITIPTSTGVTYLIDGEIHAAGTHVITEDAVVEATADDGYYFAPNQTVSWSFTFVQT
jgi:HK97 family phage prohead protease